MRKRECDVFQSPKELTVSVALRQLDSTAVPDKLLLSLVLWYKRMCASASVISQQPPCDAMRCYAMRLIKMQH